MSAPKTDLDTQEERHKPSLLGIRGVMIFGALMLVGIVAISFMRGADSGATAYEGVEEPVAGTSNNSNMVEEAGTDEGTTVVQD